MTENLINDLLDMAKLENNAFTLQEEYFSLPEAIHQTFQICATSAKIKGVTFNACITRLKDLDLVQTLMGDKARYQQILMNFISNSLKFTPKGGSITVQIDIQESTEIQSQSSTIKPKYRNLIINDNNLKQT